MHQPQRGYIAMCHWGRTRLSLDYAISHDQTQSQLDFLFQELLGPCRREGQRMPRLAEVTSPVFYLLNDKHLELI